MEVNVKFTADELELVFDAIQALKDEIDSLCGSQEYIGTVYQNVHNLELRLRDILKGAIATSMS